ncbi:MAG: hypothetical protein SGILL_000474 [Bacillariaceae sp.]
MLRMHGYHPRTLRLIVGTQLSASSYQVGDLVVPKKITKDSAQEAGDCFGIDDAVGRVAPETSSGGPLPSTVRARGAGSVMVEFVSGSFVDGVSVQSASSGSEKTIESRRIPSSRLVHTSVFHGLDAAQQPRSVTLPARRKSQRQPAIDMIVDEAPTSFFEDEYCIDGSVLSDLQGMKYLDPTAIERIIKECNKTSTSLGALFEAKFTKISLQALDCVQKNIELAESDESLAHSLTLLGKLALLVAEKAFPDEVSSEEDEESGPPHELHDAPLDNERAAETRVQDEAGPIVNLEESLDRSSEETNRTSRAYSLQQRRRMLLSLMSRARQGDVGSLSDFVLSRDTNGIASFDISPDAAAALFFGAPGEAGLGASMEEESNARFENSRPNEARGQPGISTDHKKESSEATLFETLLRGRNCALRAPSSHGKWTVPACSVNSIVAMGILGNSLPWLTSLLHSVSKKMPRKHVSKGVLLLKDTVDEDGMPLLRLAITLGCSVGVVRHLIRNGCTVGNAEIQLAAECNLPDILSVLLHYTAYTEGTIDTDKCSCVISAVIKDSVKRQGEEMKKICKGASDFLIPFFRKMTEVCLARRRHHHNKNDCFSRAIAGALVGNVELRAAKIQRPGNALEKEVDPERSPHALGMSPRGLMQALPTSILGQSLGEAPSYLTTLLLLIEDYLCSKSVNDGCVGLTMLLTVLKRFPSLAHSQEMERYGFAELICSHDALASNKLDYISNRLANNASTSNDRGPVLCPKKHGASLHVTKHASFRCDLCGKGVEKGAVMHGCRQCDWDACESCTDKAEGGVVKWRLLRELASCCQDLLCLDDAMSTDDAMKEDNAYAQQMIENLKSMDNSSSINTLSIGLLQRDLSSIHTLATMLSSRGQITMHQFVSVIMPALHSSLVDRNNCGIRSKKNRRSKKPRVGGNGFTTRDVEDKPQSRDDERIEFAKEVLSSLVSRPSQGRSSNGIVNTESRSHDRDPESLEDSDDDDESVDAGDNRGSFSREKSKRIEACDFLRRLHQVLTLHEDVTCFSIVQSGGKDAVSPSELRSLKSPIKVVLSESDQKQATTILAEPLVSVSDLSLQLLKTALIENGQYSAFCQALVEEKAIILDRPFRRSPGDDETWRIAKVSSYDTKGGWHTVNYASGYSRRNGQDLHLLHPDDFGRFKFEAKDSRLILSSREYVVIYRDSGVSESKSPLDTAEGFAGPSGVQKGKNEISQSVVGDQVESDFAVPEWRSYTIVAVDSSANNQLYDLVSDKGEVVCGVPESRIRGLSEGAEGRSSAVDLTVTDRESAEARHSLGRAFPFFTTRRQLSDEEIGLSGPKRSGRRTLKRTWSALAPIESMRPVEMSAESTKFASLSPSLLSWKCDLGHVQIEEDLVELPPAITVSFSSPRDASQVRIPSPANTTLVSLLCQLHRGEEFDLFEDQGHLVTYSVSIRPSKSLHRVRNLKRSAPEATAGFIQASDMVIDHFGTTPGIAQQNRSRKLSDSQLASSSDDEFTGILSSCDGLDEVCIQCLEIFECLAGSQKEKDASFAPFVNQALSQKLREQLENPLIVAGGACPSWCVALPSFSPHVFTYESRKMLLDRVGFGVSRSTQKLQEAKVNVGRLRQRMTALRARAVELVGEAFSGGAQDPTALQLQADELYGMEEALGARIRSSFRAEGWQEQSVEVAKATICREVLISDAISIMDQYASNPRLNRRRLEIKFDGESGFDAASGDEAGVTRGFYADVAEALLSCNLVSGVCISVACPTDINTSNCMDSISLSSDGKSTCKLALWIPDVDASSKVIIPTPRASPESFVGVFPRPLSKTHPQLGDLLRTYRFMGRLFAAAMRDGFMFPLPLSAAFLKLVQHSGSSSSSSGTEEEILSSCDLPRPGFLGGEVYATEMHICAALDKIDNTNPALNKAERDREYDRIASDKTFAQIALGKSYECSFNEYFEDKTFVDPLDPTQGEEAHPLCKDGHSRRVTIGNVREWVSLAKEFILCEGVIMQAAAFRSGVNDFFPSDYLRLFTSEELQRDVCGVGDNVDSWSESDIRKLFKLDGKGSAEALVAVAAIGGNAEALSRRFGPSSPTIKFVIKALLEATSIQRRQFLNFVTSTIVFAEI